MSGTPLQATYRVISLIFFIMPIVTWIALMGRRSRSLYLWCGGSLLFSGGLTLLSLRGAFPDWATYPLAQALAFFGQAMHVQAIQLKYGLAWRLPHLLMMGLCYVVLFEILHHIVGNDRLRAGYASLVQVTLLMCIGWAAWRLWQKKYNRNSLMIAVGTTVFATAIFIRIPLNYDSFLIPLGGLIGSIASHVGYIGITLEEAVRAEAESFASKARLEEAQVFANQLARLERQRSMGLMAATLGHELMQPLAAILTNARVLRRRLETDRNEKAKVLELCDRIAANTRRAAHIIDSIRTFIRPNEMVMVPVHLEEVTKEVLELIKGEARRCRITVDFIPALGSPLVLGDPVQLSQVLLNVLRNALEPLQAATHRQGHVRIHRHGDRVCVSVRDTGPGFPLAMLNEQCTEFKTHKPKGLGMGLAISRSIVQQHQGTLQTRNAEEGGGMVDICLPALAPAGGSCA
ncbi:MAG: ATP-binding protein [Acidobacteria bacterium]|nr:ATP-binding protein [Acidobacteriota bacterium]